MKIIITKNEKETFKLGEKIGKNCQGGEVFVLNGDLGTGKTKLLQGLAQGLGVKERVTSPTFNILKIYKGSGKIEKFCHVDAYRLHSGQDLLILGIEEYFDSIKNVTAIEWAEKVKEIWPSKAIIIKIKNISLNKRKISID